MSIASCNNLMVERIHRWLYCPATPPWQVPCVPVEPCCETMPDQRVDRAEWSPEAIAMCGHAEQHRPAYPALEPRSSDEPPGIVIKHVEQPVYTPVVAGSLLDIWA